MATLLRHQNGPMQWLSDAPCCPPVMQVMYVHTNSSVCGADSTDTDVLVVAPAHNTVVDAKGWL